MKINLTIRKILQEIMVEIKEEKGLDLSEQEVYDIVDSQFRGASICMFKGIETRIPIIGSFKRMHKQEIIDSIKSVDLANIVKENEKNEAILAAKLKFLEKRKKRQEETKLNIKSIDDLRKLDDITIKNYPYKKLFENDRDQ